MRRDPPAPDAAAPRGVGHDVGALLLRLAVGGLMLFHGVAKVSHGVGWMRGVLSEAGLPSALAYGAYVGEVVAPVLLMAGVAVRSAGATIAFTMGMAVYLRHGADLLSLGPHGGYALELQALYALGAIAAALIGPGRFAVPVPRLLARL